MQYVPMDKIKTEENQPRHRETVIADRGWDLVRGMIPQSMVSSLQERIAKLYSSGKKPSSQVLYTHSLPPAGTPDFSAIMTLWINPVGLPELSTREECENLKQILFGEQADDWLLFQEVLFMKQRGQGVFHWHQDMPFFPLDNAEGFTCWIALDVCTELNGSLMLSGNSHMNGQEVSIDLHTGMGQDGAGFAFEPEQGTIVQPELKPGDSLLFHPLTFHASGPNYSQEPRRSWATVWFRKGVRWKKENAPNHPGLSVVEDGSFVSGYL